MLLAYARWFITPPDTTGLTPFTWALCGLLFTTSAVTVRYFGFSVAVPPALVACAVATGVILFLMRGSDLARRVPALTLGCLLYILFGLQSLAAVVLSYTVLATNLPLTDSVFLGIDRALGFDWLAFRQSVLAIPILEEGLARAYGSLPIQYAIIPALLLVTGRARRIETLLAAVIVCEIVACVVSALWPCASVASLAGFDTVAAATPSADHLLHYFPVREGSLRSLDATHLYGLITFPSFHCAAAYLAVAALWPMRWTRVPMLLLNGAMTVSAVTHGAHYLADCVAGLALAAVAFPLCQHAVRCSAAVAAFRLTRASVARGEAAA